MSRFYIFCAVAVLGFFQPSSIRAEITYPGTPEEHRVHKDRIVSTVTNTIADIADGEFDAPLEILLVRRSGDKHLGSLKHEEYKKIVQETLRYCKESYVVRGFAGDTESDIKYMAAGQKYSCDGLEGVRSRELFVVLNNSFFPMAMFVKDNILAVPAIPKGSD